jgi:hypothetical protein
MRLFTSGSTAGGVEGAGVEGAGVEGAGVEGSGAEVAGVNGRIDATVAKRGGPSAGGCALTAPLETRSFNC